MRYFVYDYHHKLIHDYDEKTSNNHNAGGTDGISRMSAKQNRINA